MCRRQGGRRKGGFENMAAAESGEVLYATGSVEAQEAAAGSVVAESGDDNGRGTVGSRPRGGEEEAGAAKEGVRIKVWCERHMDGAGRPTRQAERDGDRRIASQAGGTQRRTEGAYRRWKRVGCGVAAKDWAVTSDACQVDTPCVIHGSADDQKAANAAAEERAVATQGTAMTCARSVTCRVIRGETRQIGGAAGAANGAGAKEARPPQENRGDRGDEKPRDGSDGQ